MHFLQIMIKIVKKNKFLISDNDHAEKIMLFMRYEGF